jgi:hypothetical protein
MKPDNVEWAANFGRFRGFANVSIRFGVLWVLTFAGLRLLFVVQSP